MVLAGRVCVVLLIVQGCSISLEYKRLWIDPWFGHIPDATPSRNHPKYPSEHLEKALAARLEKQPALRAHAIGAGAKNIAAGKLPHEGSIIEGVLEQRVITFEHFNVFFVTDCSAHQRWMAFNVFNSAQRAGQKNPIIWVRAGCKEGAARYAHDTKHAHSMYPLAYVYDVQGNQFASDFNLAGGVPKAVDSFLSAHPNLGNDTMLAMIEADMIFLQPLTLEHISSQSIPSQDQELVWEGGRIYGKTLGIAAHYLCCDGLGPPYILPTSGWRRLSPQWSSSKLSGGWGGDQQAFAASARTVGLQFNVFDDIMVSSPETMPNGWSLVHTALRSDAGDTCLTQRFGMHHGVSNLPILLHVVRPWSTQANRAAAAWGFSKYQVPPGWHHPESNDGILECGMPMFAVPPRDFLAMLGSKQSDGWVLCTILHSLNDMLYTYKSLTCPGGFNKAKALKMKVPLQWTNVLLPGAEYGTPEGTDLTWMRRCATEPNC